MPIYEFRCGACGERITVFQRSISASVQGECPHCGSGDLRRLISQFAVVRSAGDAVDDPLDDSMLEGLGDLDESDPRQMAAWARRMQSRLGEDLGPEFDEMVDRLEAGEPLDETGSPDGGNFDDFEE